ncbi:MAG: ComF family protein [Brevirhabdus sp.]
MAYRDNGRRLILALKHQDRTDIARPAASWMASALARTSTKSPLLVPVPSHPFRLLGRRYNQAALLSGWIARQTTWAHIPDMLLRVRRTPPNKDMTTDERFANQSGAFAVASRHRATLKGRDVVLIDDVMTSGATLTACAEQCRDAGARRIVVQTLARVAREL